MKERTRAQLMILSSSFLPGYLGEHLTLQLEGDKRKKAKGGKHRAAWQFKKIQFKGET